MRMEKLYLWLFGPFSFPAFSIIPPGKIFFQPDVEADEEVAGSHFVDFQFGHAGSAVVPGDGNNGVGIAADDGFEGEFDGDVEVGRENGADAIMMTTASPEMEFNPRVMARPKPCGAGFWMGTRVEG